MFILGSFLSDEILNHVPLNLKEKKKKEFKNNKGEVFNVKLSSTRLIVFKKNKTCACCGIEGSIFLLERSTKFENPHFNLYAKIGDELILMTKDHIVPSSQGGKDSLDNLQTMCSKCNQLKGNLFISNDNMKKARKYYLSRKKEGDTHKEAFHKMKRFIKNNNYEINNNRNRVS